MQLGYDYNYPIPPRAWINRATKDTMVLGRGIPVSSANEARLHPGYPVRLN
jgi:hypothetical protein